MLVSFIKIIVALLALLIAVNIRFKVLNLIIGIILLLGGRMFTKSYLSNEIVEAISFGFIQAFILQCFLLKKEKRKPQH
ncbi:MAG: hypothetical protein KAX49_18960 [Halanaerobiales bacterium]|nr:hypothetical protein [Halanaerobiales bacterium]